MDINSIFINILVAVVAIVITYYVTANHYKAENEKLAKKLFEAVTEYEETRKIHDDLSDTLEQLETKVSEASKRV